MKLNLTLNGNEAPLSYVQPVVAAAGSNSSITVNSAETWTSANLNTLATTAASRSLALNLVFNARFVTLATLQSLIGVTGANTTISLQLAHDWPAANLSALIQAAASKRLNLAFNGDETILSYLQPLVTAAAANTGFSMARAELWTSTDLSAIVQTAGAKRLSLDFAAENSLLSQVQAALANATSSTNINLALAGFWTTANLQSILASAGSKNLALTFSADLATLSLMQSLVSQAGSNTNISMSATETWSASNLTSLEGTAGAVKRLNLTFTASSALLSLLQTALASLGANSSVTLNAAQAWTAQNLTTIAQNAGAKRFNMQFNAIQTNLPLVQSAVNNAGTNTTIIVSPAQVYTSQALVGLVQTAA